jgi:hypothetical protein
MAVVSSRRAHRGGGSAILVRPGSHCGPLSGAKCRSSLGKAQCRADRYAYRIQKARMPLNYRARADQRRPRVRRRPIRPQAIIPRTERSAVGDEVDIVVSAIAASAQEEQGEFQKANRALIDERIRLSKIMYIFTNCAQNSPSANSDVATKCEPFKGDIFDRSSPPSS